LTDLQRRMGHSTVNAAMAYAHASRDNWRSIAERMNAQRATVVDINSHVGPAERSEVVSREPPRRQGRLHK